VIVTDIDVATKK